MAPALESIIREAYAAFGRRDVDGSLSAAREGKLSAYREQPVIPGAIEEACEML
jgi:hypothetical protein